MIKKIFAIFARDVKVSLRNFIAIYIIIFPILFAIIINVFVSDVNDTTVSLALLNGEDPELTAYLKDFARVELFDSVEAIEARLKKRDNIVAILPDSDNYYILTQGNEPEFVVDFAKSLRAFYELGITVEDTKAEIVEFGKMLPPMKKMLVNSAIMLASVLGGMLIALNIVEEKVDNTISAVNVTPISRTGYIIGKTTIGILVPIVGTTLMLIMTGFGDVNFGQALVMIVTSSIISILVGFIEGINNDDFINAAANIKILFLPLVGAVAAIEFLSDKWQKFFYWIPFYWTYKGNELILSKSGTWPQILGYAAIVVGISSIVFVISAPKIRKGLE